MRFARPRRQPIAVDVERLLAGLGISTGLERRAGALWARCPLPGHLGKTGKPERTASWSIVVDRESRRYGAWFCFGCAVGGGPVQLVEQVINLDASDAWKWLEGIGVRLPAAPRGAVIEVASRIGSRLEWPNEGVITDPLDWPAGARRYFEETRGFPLAVAVDYGIVASGADCPHAPRSIVVPVYSFGAVRTWVARSYAGGRKHMSADREDGAQPDLALWGEPRLDPEAGPALVCEGVYDALSLACVGLPNAVAVLGASNLAPAKQAAIARCPEVIVCTDADPAGDKAWQELSGALARHCRVERALPPQGHDFGDAPVESILETVDQARARLAGRRAS